MIDTFVKGWDAAQHVLDTLPPWLAAFFIGWLVSVAVTQVFKFTMPLAWWPDLREDFARWVAFMSAAIPAMFYVGHAGYGPLGMAVQAIVTGAWAPLVYALLVIWLRRDPRRAWIADVLSQDKRGVLAAKLRGQEGEP